MYASTLPKQELPLSAQLHEEEKEDTSHHIASHHIASHHITSHHKHALLQITVDGDTSTNDTCIGLASGAAGNDLIKHSTSEAAQKLEAAVTALLQVLQLQIPAH